MGWKTVLNTTKQETDIKVLEGLLGIEVDGLEDGVFESEGYLFSVSDIQPNHFFTVTFEKIIPPVTLTYEGFNLDLSFKDSIEVIYSHLDNNEAYVNRLRMNFLKKINALEKLLRD